MKTLKKFCGLAAMLCAGLLAGGCGEDVESKRPEALPVAEAPTTLEEAYAGATGEVRTMADEAIRFLRVQDYPRALVVLQQLSARTDLTSDQRNLTAKALLTADQKVSEAAQSGNKEAERLQQYRQFTK